MKKICSSDNKLKIVNIKASFLMSKKIGPQIATKYKRRGGEGLRITVFKHSQKLVNVTGIKNLKHFQEVRNFVRNYYYKVKGSYVLSDRIDNIMVTRRMSCNYNMSAILSACKKLYRKNYCTYFGDEDRLTCKAIVLQPKERGKEDCVNGTFLLYYTGSVTIMGLKEYEEIELCQQMVDRIYNRAFQYGLKMKKRKVT
jgi:hypothetical protein